MTKPTIIISGAGVAGTVLAYWLGKYGFRITLVERSSSQGAALQGQIIDVEGPAREIVQRMGTGVLEKLKARSTHEEGLTFVDADNTTLCSIPMGKTALSTEIEIMRPELARTLLETLDGMENVTLHWNTTIESISDQNTDVKVTLKDRTNGQTREAVFDLLVAADGLRSKTRDLILGPTLSQSSIWSVRIFVAFFSVPALPRDRPFSRLYHSPGRRGIFIKPQTEKESSIYFMYGKYNESWHEARESHNIQQQKDAIAQTFAGLGWETDRLLRDMQTTSNFYFEEISQVYLDKWSKGHCCLLGDTAYCPSPLTGQGTNLAITGAYILANALIQTPEQPEQAFTEYEKRFRPYVNKKQPIPLGGKVTNLTLPQTRLGIWLLQTLAWLVSLIQVWKILPGWAQVGTDLGIELPDLR